MSSVVPYFVLTIVALGFFAVCYAVFNRGDGKSQTRDTKRDTRVRHTRHNTDTGHGSKAYPEIPFLNKEPGADSYQRELQYDIPLQNNGSGVDTYQHESLQDTSFHSDSHNADGYQDEYSRVPSPQNQQFNVDDNQEALVQDIQPQNEYALALVDSRESDLIPDEYVAYKTSLKLGDPEREDTSATSDVPDTQDAADSPEQLVVSNLQATSDTIILDAVTDEMRQQSEGVEDTIAMGESLEALAADKEEAIDATQMIGGVIKEKRNDQEQAAPQALSALEETRLFDAAEINEQLAATERLHEESSSHAVPQIDYEDKYLEMAMAPFTHAFGVLSGDTHQYVESITRDALAALNVTTVAEVNVLLDNIVIQEALMSMQKAYAGTTTEWMKSAALGAFLDVVQSPKSSTPYLVAFDALRVLPHMTLGHFQVMALTLLLQYSRNSNNYGLIHFQHYVEKYIEPFISDLPQNPSFYRQLEYLRCTQEEREPITLAQVLSNSYPFVFNYRGFTKEELFRATDGHGVDPRYVVRSLNSNLYKLALVDEAMAPRFFRETRISNFMVQRDLIALMKSKPTAFAGQEARDIMDDISPVLLDLADVFDNTPMSSISLTLLGLYLGRAHVKATIGEEFDLSHWF